MKVLVINSGSSSIKYKLFDMETGASIASGLVEKIGEEDSRLEHQVHLPGQPAETHVRSGRLVDHRQGLMLVADILTDAEHGVVAERTDIIAVGHRVVHGGEAFHEPTLIDNDVIAAIQAHIPLAPLHNPANLTGIEVSHEIFPDARQVAVFDTAFHQTMPPHAFRYALPQALYEQSRVRRYGFHGTSHRYVFHEAAGHLSVKPEALNAITVHLGNGCSITAIEGGRSVDTSMGLTPLEGLIMGTRSGDLDPAIPFYLSTHDGMTIGDIDRLLNKQSGMKGICGSNDIRDILAKRDAGDERAALALDMYTYRVRKYVGAYYAALGRLDALVFTAGVGENSPDIRRGVCRGLEGMGIKLDETLNRARTPGIRAIDDKTVPGGVAVLVVPTNEELEIARQTLDIIPAVRQRQLHFSG